MGQADDDERTVRTMRLARRGVGNDCDRAVLIKFFRCFPYFCPQDPQIFFACGALKWPKNGLRQGAAAPPAAKSGTLGLSIIPVSSERESPPRGGRESSWLASALKFSSL